MRSAELVVKYLEGPALPSDLVEYAGVFVCDDEVEKAFAAAEPPAHDDWIPDYLTGRDNTFVNVALKRIREKLKEMVASVSGSSSAAGDRVALGSFADSLGGLLLGVDGQRVGPISPPGGGGHRGRRAVTASRPIPDGFREINGDPCALFRTVLNGNGKQRARITGRARILLEGGSKIDIPVGVTAPETVAWMTDDGSDLTPGADLTTAPGKNQSMLIAVRLPEDCAVTLDLDVQLEP